MKPSSFKIYALLILSLVACSSGSSTTTRNFKFTGTIEGLQGDLVLQETKSEKNVTIDENGEFEFEAELDPNADYEIRVLEEPCKQRCTVDFPTGNIEDKIEVELKISCDSKSWDTPGALSDKISFDADEVSGFDVSMNKYGDKMIVWTQPYGGIQRFYKSEFINRIWTRATQSNYISMGSQNVGVEDSAISDSGNSFVIWTQSDGANEQVYSAEAIDGIWKYPLSITDSLSDAGTDIDLVDDNALHIKSNNKGEAVATWIQLYSGANRRIYYSYFKNGSWGDPVALSDNLTSPSAETIEDLDVALNDDGKFAIIWKMIVGGAGSRIYLATNVEGTLDKPSGNTDGLNFYDASSQANGGSVDIDNDNNIVVVWHQTAQDGFLQIFRKEYRDGVWDTVADLADNISANGVNSTYPQVALNNKGQGIIAWKQDDGETVIYIKTKEPGQSWTNPVVISPDETNADPPNVDIDDDGNILVGWKQENLPSGSMIYNIKKSQRFHGQWTHPTINDQVSAGSSDARTPDVVLRNCRASIVWRQLDTNGDLQLFEASYR